MDTISKIRVKGVDYPIEDENAGGLEFLGRYTLEWSEGNDYIGDWYVSADYNNPDLSRATHPFPEEFWSIFEQSVFMKSTEEKRDPYYEGKDTSRYYFSTDFLVEEIDDYGSLDRELEYGKIYIANSYWDTPSGADASPEFPRYFLVATEQTIRDLYQKYIYSNHNVIIYDFYK
jgi:hypothetical protein